MKTILYRRKKNKEIQRVRRKERQNRRGETKKINR